MSTIVTRSGKGSPLTNAEMDDNLNNLNNDKLEGPASSTDGGLVAFNGTTGKLVKAADTGLYTAKTSNTGSSVLPAGTTDQRDGSPAAGYLRFNSTLSKYEGYDGSIWQTFDNVAQATETAAGIAEIATSAEATAGTDDLTILTPLKLRNGLNASGSAPIYACRAWVNFNGSGTVAIRASGNVSSITDNDTGDYTVNFTTALADENYSPQLTCGSGLGDIKGSSTMLTTSCRFRTYNDAGTTTDPVVVSVAIFR